MVLQVGASDRRRRRAKINARQELGFPVVYANFAPGITGGFFVPAKKMSPDPGARRSGLRTKARGAGLNRSLTETRAPTIMPER